MKQTEQFDPVSKPRGYNSYSMESIKAIKSQMTPEEYKGYLKGIIMKYLIRYPFKGGSEDLRKAMEYLNMLIDFVQEEERKDDKS